MEHGPCVRIEDKDLGLTAGGGQGSAGPGYAMGLVGRNALDPG